MLACLQLCKRRRRGINAKYQLVAISPLANFLSLSLGAGGFSIVPNIDPSKSIFFARFVVVINLFRNYLFTRDGTWWLLGKQNVNLQPHDASIHVHRTAGRRPERRHTGRIYMDKTYILINSIIQSQYLQDATFVEYFNSFLLLPVRGQVTFNGTSLYTTISCRHSHPKCFIMRELTILSKCLTVASNIRYKR